jgi:hypothetical protein
MASGRKNQLTKQIGEYLVAAELCRRGLIATTFTGNVPDFDIIATNEAFETIPIQVKTIRDGSWQLDANKFIIIEINDGVQRIIDKTRLSNPDLICIFVRLISQGDDEFYIFRLRDLQEIIFDGHSQYLEKHGGRRPKNPNSTHTGVNPKFLERFRDNWDIIMNRRTIP